MIFAICKSIELMLISFRKYLKFDLCIMLLYLVYSLSVQTSVHEIAYNMFIYFIVVPLAICPLRYFVWKRTGNIV